MAKKLDIEKAKREGNYKEAGIGNIPSTIARTVAGIVGKGAKQVNPVYRNIGEPKSAVTKIPKITDHQKNVVNKMRDVSAKNAKSGETARRLGSERETSNLKGILSGKGDPKIVKINSNPMRGK